ncbi:GIY-YIG nuclease family protein [Pleurocapsales cyanobacterium LEGE 10410]|nr:GIY-YIG nuclease family protein [Pleurocapsales cyanobacterium LEGE 10410]
MKTIGLATARWQYHTPHSIDGRITLGKIYYFEGGSAYFHHPQKPVRLGYGHKDFTLIQNKHRIKVSIYPRSLANKKVIEWFKTWSGDEDVIIPPNGVKIKLCDEVSVTERKEFIYFILNSDSNAVKIGRAKNVLKRKNTLQVANPVELVLLKTIEVNSGKEAKEKEESLHGKFAHLRILGEWFQYSTELQEFIGRL